MRSVAREEPKKKKTGREAEIDQFAKMLPACGAVTLSSFIIAKPEQRGIVLRVV